MGKIKIGSTALTFKAVEYNGKIIELESYKGNRVLLSFFRGASCPFCNMRVRELINSYGEFKKRNIEIIAIFASSQEKIKEYAGQQNAPFPIIADPELRLYQKYGIEQSKSGMFKTMLLPLKMIKMMHSGFFNMDSMNDHPIIPADFLINENFKIFSVYYGKNYSDHIPIERVINWRNS